MLESFTLEADDDPDNHKSRSLDARLYLDKCQVDTPYFLVRRVWDLISQRRTSIGNVVDFGAGDARFAFHGSYGRYVGYEIDSRRFENVSLPQNAIIHNKCAFADDVLDADLCVGNPPYVRNQNLPLGWRQLAADRIVTKTGVTVSGLANAWQYFFMQSLASTKKNGLVAIIVPYEWVSRPSSAALRDYIRVNRWSVDVYRLEDDIFEDVLTTASITIIDKNSQSGNWSYYIQGERGTFHRCASPTGSTNELIRYERANAKSVHAKRGLSPGTQEFLTLTEGERAHQGLRVGIDVVRCVTSLRPTPGKELALSDAIFRRDFVLQNKKCWLVRTDKAPSRRLETYLNSVPEKGRASSTCKNRGLWWKFNMPRPPDLLIASGFTSAPKVVNNEIGVIAVGSVCGIYLPADTDRIRLTLALRNQEYASRLVAHSNGLLKLEIHQINSLLADICDAED